MKLILLVVIGLWATSLAPVFAEEGHGLNSPRFHTVHSEVLDRSFKIHVRVPDGYGANAQSYPVVYLLDGGHTFPMLAGYASYLDFGQEIPPVIIVGISYGNDDWKKGNMRGTDFTAPAESREHYGGASMFLSFLGEELLPFIDREYQTDPGQRVLFGQSLGGQFVLYMARHRPDLFRGGIASNPALHRNLEYFTNSDVARGPHKLRLYVSSGTNDNPVFRKPARAWMEFWTDGRDVPWHLRIADLVGQTHFSAAPESFRQGMAWIFSPTR